VHVPSFPALAATDPELIALVEAETTRQHDTLRLIASENYVSAAVLEASGTVLTNKYSEGYPGKRYYEGQQYIDAIERLAIARARAVFGVDHANVQPYSGSPANLAVYLAFAQPGDTVMGMALPMGGHLTHGWSVSATGRWFRSVQYGVRRDTGRLDLDEVRDLARRERPKLIFCGGTAVPRLIDFEAFAAIAVALHEASQPAFRQYAHQIVANAKALAEALMARGFDLVSGGTDNHLILIDLTSKGIGGKPAAHALDRAGIELNYNTVPFDPRKPFDPSGIRLGTAALTTRGLAEAHMSDVARWINEVIDAEVTGRDGVQTRVAGEIQDLLAGYPAPGCTAEVGVG